MQGFYPRGPGGMFTTSTGSVVAMDDLAVVRLTAHVRPIVVNLATRRIPGVGGFELNGIAPAPDSGFYADTSAGNGYAGASALAKIEPSGLVELLWTSAK